MNKKYSIHKKFITNEECKKMSIWIDNNIKQFGDANMGGNRVTSRYYENVIYPKIAFEIQKRIINKFKFKNYKFPFKDGMYASCAYPGDTCYLHKDDIHFPEHTTIHCNVYLSDVIGGEPFVLKNPTVDEIIKVKKTDMWKYEVSNVLHGSKMLKNNLRKMWVFAFCVKNN